MRKPRERVQLLHLQCQAVFQVIGEDGRPLRVFSEEAPWVVSYAELEGLRGKVEQAEAQMTTALAKKMANPI